ncbi:MULTISPECIES: hypothetical protein [Nostoc]|uniref:Uncharacterized protein n=2 Tax=Nostoc TaxID=1177 RepID=A0ABR8IGK4_9NOSO|nr:MULTISPECIES: hypothetical protein [Nostoc]MBD2565134.1 hypothetical protein [Nostoc linckia FACHB-391]MBD2650735.1 hypothetical protein [Nostoc foliaceum FACHB-393]
MYNPVPVFQRLLQDNPHLFTTEGLSSLLLDCVHMKSPNHHKFTYPSLLNKQVYLAIAGLEGSAEDEVMIYRIMSDPQAWYNFTKVRQQGQPSENIGEEFYSSFGIEIYLQHRIINSIRCLQKSLNISGVRQTNIAVRDRLFSYPKVEEHLVILDRDRLTLQQAVPEIIKYFVSLAQIPPEYRLFLVDEKKQKIPTSVSTVKNVALSAAIAEISTESFDRQLTGTNCWCDKSVERVDPDKIRLTLHLDWNENEFIFFEAQHQNLSRFLWTTEAAY